MNSDQQHSLLSPFGWHERFELAEKIGSGAMGQVWTARETDTERWVALKLLVSHRVGDLNAVARVEAEGLTLMRLKTAGQHPNVVPIIDFAVTDEHACLVMEYVPGATLASAMVRAMPDMRTTVTLMARVARACGWFHQLGVVHRDLKPENIILQEADGEPVILDFSIAKDQEALMSLTVDQDLGTAAYMAPEQFGHSREKITPATDVHAIGVMLYEMLTGQLPFPGEYLHVLSQKLAGERPEYPRSLRPDLPHALEGIVWKALTPSASERYPDGDALADELERFLAGQPVQTSPVPRLAHLGQRLRGKSQPLMVLSAVLVAGMGGWFSWPLLDAQVSPGRSASSQPEELDLSAPADHGLQLEAGFIDLLSPEKLPFWKDDDRGGFHFADGVATSWTDKEDPSAGLWVFTETAFSDFVLRLQFLGDDPKSNSGAFLHCQPRPDGFLREACQVQIGRYPASQPTGSIYGRQSARPSPLRGAGQWNDLEIIAQGAKYFVSLNGVRVTAYESPQKQSGYLAFQNHMDGVVKLRQMRIRPLGPAADVPLNDAFKERFGRDQRRQSGALIPGVDDVFPPLVGSWKVTFRGSQVQHLRIHPDGRFLLAEPDGRIFFMHARDGYAVSETARDTLDRFSMKDGLLEIERWKPADLFGSQEPTDIGHGVKISSAEVAGASARLAEFTQIVQGSRWRYHDEGYPSSDVSFGTDGRFHDRWRWRYWIMEPGVIHIQFADAPYDPRQVTVLSFDAVSQSFRGQFVDPRGRTHRLRVERL